MCDTRLVVELVSAYTLLHTRLVLSNEYPHLSISLHDLTLRTEEEYGVARRVFHAWKSSIRHIRVNSWMRRRVRDDDTPILC